MGAWYDDFPKESGKNCWYLQKLLTRPLSLLHHCFLEYGPVGGITDISNWLSYWGSSRIIYIILTCFKCFWNLENHIYIDLIYEGENTANLLVSNPPFYCKESGSLAIAFRDVLMKKNTAVLLDFVQIRGGGGEGPAQFFVTFSRGAFLFNKGAYFFQNANYLNCKLFFYVV